MKRRNYLWICLLLALTLTACQSATQNGKPTDAAQSDEIAAPVEETETPATPETDATESETPRQSEDTDAPEQSAEPETPEQSAQTETPVGNPHELTAEELQTWGEFLSGVECYGFLMSDYSTPLEADLGQVFYTGAGAGERPEEETLNDYLKANDFEEAYTDVTFIPYDAANQILERRTGYTLEHFKLAGNDIPMYYSDKYKGYFQMAGDTNRIRVECVSGQENADGSIFLKSREKSWSDDPDEIDEYASTFETTLRPDVQSGNMVFDTNAVTGGWLLSMREWMFEEDETE